MLTNERQSHYTTGALSCFFVYNLCKVEKSHRKMWWFVPQKTKSGCTKTKHWLLSTIYSRFLRMKMSRFWSCSACSMILKAGGWLQVGTTAHCTGWHFDQSCYFSFKLFTTYAEQTQFVPLGETTEGNRAEGFPEGIPLGLLQRGGGQTWQSQHRAIRTHHVI